MSSFWKECEIDEYGAHWQGADVDSEGAKPLFVFVHGICGHFKYSWKRVPELLAEQFPRAEILSYSYNSYPWNRASIQQAARQLKAVLVERFASTRDIIFVTHSTGGLIVKELFRRETPSGEVDRTHARSYHHDLPIAVRCRWIINVAVPHAGGSVVLTSLAVTVYVLLLPFVLLFVLISFLSFGNLNWGLNRIIFQLFYRNRWLRALDNDFRGVLQENATSSIPTPSVFDIRPDQDKAVPPLREDDRLRTPAAEEEEELLARATHWFAGVIRRHSDLIMKAIINRTRWVSCESVARDMDASEIILARARRLFEEAGAVRLIDSAASTPELGSQYSLYQEIMRLASESGATPRRIILTGAAGVGKSLTLAQIARDLAARHLSKPGGNSPLPILMPLQQINLTPEQLTTMMKGASWDFFCEFYCKEASALIQEEGGVGEVRPRSDRLTAEWLEERCMRKPTVLILDGVDDFLMNHPMLGLDDIEALVQSIQTLFQVNGDLLIVLGMRSSHPGMRALAFSGTLYEIGRLTMDQAEAHFPGARAAVQQVSSESARELLLTPLILSKFTHIFRSETPMFGDDRAEIFERTLREIIVCSGILSSPAIKQAAAGQGNLSAILLDCLMILGWVYYREFRAEVSLSGISNAVRDIRSRWQAKPPEAFNLLAFDLLERPETLKILFERTVFSSVGGERYRFGHREWEEYLVARYVARSIHFGLVDELGIRSVTQQIVHPAAYWLSDTTVDQDLVNLIYDRASVTGNHLISGSFGGLLANMYSPMSGHAFELICSRAFESDLVAGQHVTIIGLAARALRNSPKDDSALFLRQAVVPFLQQLTRYPDECQDAFLASDAFCHLKAIERQFHFECTQNLSWNWPRDEQEIRRDALREVWVETTDPLTTLMFRSIQMALVQIARESRDWPTISISAVHHLLAVVEARHRNVQFADVEGELSEIFSENSSVSSSLEHACKDLSPETLVLFQAAKEIYLG